MRRVLFVVLLAAACAPAPEADGVDPGCTGEKCDLPDDPAVVSCELRRGEAFSKNQAGFTEAALRWSCNDARGVTAEDRGQEYCEYFAVIQTPGGASQVLGRNLGYDSKQGTTPVAATLTAAQRQALEADAAAVVGQCVFSSWNSDIDRAVTLPAQPVAGLAVTATDFRMKFDTNSNEAAQMLVDDCTKTKPGKDFDAFTRACLMNDEINGTSFRKSDTTVCAASMRMAECHCHLKSGGDVSELAKALSPVEKRGFPLGTWTSPTALPPSCRYVDLGDASRTLVSCDLTAGDVLASSSDPKARCRDKYADNVVVHVPIPAADLVCDASCGASPWVVTP